MGGTYEIYIAKHIRPALDRLQVGRLNSDVVESFYAQLRHCRERWPVDAVESRLIRQRTSAACTVEPAFSAGWRCGPVPDDAAAAAHPPHGCGSVLFALPQSSHPFRRGG